MSGPRRRRPSVFLPPALVSALLCGCGSEDSPPAAALDLPAPHELRGAAELDGLVRVEGREGFWVGDRQHPPHYQTDVGEFWMAPCETTQALWHRVMGDQPSGTRGEDHPVERVSWEDAARFCNRLSAIFGRAACYDEARRFAAVEGADGFRLPTSAEWEWASRGESAARYAWGPDFDERWCVPPITKSEHRDLDETRDSRTAPVRTREPNPRGLYDLHGNVSEWCEDLFDGHPGWRVIRGGSWADFQRLAFEAKWSRGLQQDEALPSIGFRIVTSRPLEPDR